MENVNAMHFITKLSAQTQLLSTSDGRTTEVLVLNISYQPGKGQAPIALPPLHLTAQHARDLAQSIGGLFPDQQPPTPGGAKQSVQ